MSCGTSLSEQVEPSYAHNRVGTESHPDTCLQKLLQRCGPMLMRSVRQRAMGHCCSRPSKTLDVSRIDLHRVNAKAALRKHPVFSEPVNRCFPEWLRQGNSARPPRLGERARAGGKKLLLRC